MLRASLPWLFVLSFLHSRCYGFIFSLPVCESCTSVAFLLQVNPIGFSGDHYFGDPSVFGQPSLINRRAFYSLVIDRPSGNPWLFSFPWGLLFECFRSPDRPLVHTSLRCLFDFHSEHGIVACNFSFVRLASLCWLRSWFPSLIRILFAHVPVPFSSLLSAVKSVLLIYKHLCSRYHNDWQSMAIE